MENIKFDLSKTYGNFRAMNAVNNGPIHKRHANDQSRSNLEDYKAARIPYARNHDASYCSSYGGEHTVDISAIFPNFDADPYKEESYDFACTDEYIAVTLEAGTETFFRLGQKIEHYIKKFNIYPPKDVKKWAVICEHIIRHYNEGWANGYEYGIKYWEIWNEPDLDSDYKDGKWVYRDYRRTWGGNIEEFYELYEVAAKHLKSCFPNLKVGGPALCGKVDWGADFLCEMQKRNVPIDFFSWHIYSNRVGHVIERAAAVREAMDKYGYGDAESILNEWNYVQGWIGDEFTYSIEQIIGLKGSAFTLATMCASQKSDIIDMLMYYDARPCAFNGLWDFYTLRPFKGYYPFYWYGMFYDCEAEVRSEADPEDVYTLCGVDKNGKTTTTVTYYTNDDNAPSKDVKLDFGKEGEYEVYYLDNSHDPQVAVKTSKLEFTLERCASILVKEI
ncbi:MAG: hypothetical protein E7612_07435 [Ruminococcaceae bacterium]|nr:hypothetical protein [Oscillospiraceae bacterium]